jgi:glycosyltransferase involved in cell wall biosynthesis
MNSKPLLSIAIPSYEAKGFGVIYLEKNFKILLDQTFQDFEIIISDNSKDDNILKLTYKYNHLLNIKYFKNDKIGMSKNTNFAIEKSSGDFIKILYQDDFLYSRHSLSDIAKETVNDFDWLVTACEHSNDGETFYRSFYPIYNDDIHLGNNTISSPSVLTIKNSQNKLFFDENITWLMDVDYYKRCYKKFGNPRVLNRINVVNRTSLSQTSSSISEKQIREETEYTYLKHL